MNIMRIDVDQLKASFDMLVLIKEDTELKPKAATGGGEYAGPCPFCGGRDRFCVQPNHPNGSRWMCRNCTGGKWQDVIAYVMRRDAVNFVEACRRLGADDTIDSRSCRRKPKQPVSKPQAPPAAEWQAQARQVIESCEATLWTDHGKKAREWLHARGLRDETLHRWRIGYHRAACKIAGLYTDRGIVIPCQVDGVVWYIKVRRPDGEPKYRKIAGSKVGLFGTETLVGHDFAVLCEGEFDAMLLWQDAGDQVGVATLGSASDPLEVPVWARYLLPVSRFLVAYDMDGKSERGANALTALSARMRRINIPQLRPDNKDITDYWKSGGNLRDWIAFEMARNGCKEIVEDPRKFHQQTLDEIVGAIQSHERQTGCTWAEILVDVQSQNPDLARRYHSAYAAADCDIYGRRKSGTLTQRDIDEFKSALAIWR